MGTADQLTISPSGSLVGLQSAAAIKNRINTRTGFLKQNREFFENAFTANTSVLYHENDAVRGFITYNQFGYILFLGVDPDYTRQGVASMLLEEVANECPVLGCHVRASNTAAQQLYDGFGFIVLEELDKYYDDGEDALYLERSNGVMS